MRSDNSVCDDKSFFARMALHIISGALRNHAQALVAVGETLVLVFALWLSSALAHCHSVFSG